ncbi:MAG: helix-turn-helix domain-containing protein [Clostridia bacterium]
MKTSIFSIIQSRYHVNQSGLALLIRKKTHTKVSQVTISKWKSGMRAPRAIIVQALAELAECTIEEVSRNIYEYSKIIEGAKINGNYNRNSSKKTEKSA